MSQTYPSKKRQPRGGESVHRSWQFLPWGTCASSHQARMPLPGALLTLLAPTQVPCLEETLTMLRETFQISCQEILERKH